MGKSFRSVEDMAKAAPQTRGDSQTSTERHSRTILRGGTQIRRQEYEPDSLRTMLAALDRHLRQAGANFSIIKDREFDECRKTLNGRAIMLREEGLGKKMKADALTLEEEEQLWTIGVLGGNNAVSLNHTVFFILSQQFGTRGCQEHHQLRVEDLKFVCDPQGKTMYVEWVEGPTKTRQGGLRKMDRRLPQKLFVTDDERCPVRFLEQIISKR